MRSPDVAVLIPALNEEQALPAVLTGLAALCPARFDRLRVVLCDNGSTDQTANVARGHGAEVVSAPARGYGNALLAGIARIKEDPPRVVVIMDADHSNDAAELPTLVDPILAGEADLVLGERLTRGDPAGLTLPQRWGNRLATSLIYRRTGHRYVDMGPFRALSWPALQRLGMVDRTWGWNVEMQMKAAKLGLRVREVPVNNRARIGQSKISGTVSGVLRAGGKIVYACWKYG